MTIYLGLTGKTGYRKEYFSTIVHAGIATSINNAFLTSGIRGLLGFAILTKSTIS